MQLLSSMKLISFFNDKEQGGQEMKYPADSHS